jgi:rRNA maturation RNase YbeY
MFVGAVFGPAPCRVGGRCSWSPRFSREAQEVQFPCSFSSGVAKCSPNSSYYSKTAEKSALWRNDAQQRAFARCLADAEHRSIAPRVRRQARRPRLRVLASPSEDLSLASAALESVLSWCRRDARDALRAALAVTLPSLAPLSAKAATACPQTPELHQGQRQALSSGVVGSTQDSLDSERRFIAPLEKVFMQEPVPSQIELSIYLCTDAHIQLLNKHYRSVDAPTDVLSFPQQQLRILGDVVISLDTAQRQAGGRLRDELRTLLLHGILHLLGFDHEIDEQHHILFAQAEERITQMLEWRGRGLIAMISERDDHESHDGP